MGQSSSSVSPSNSGEHQPQRKPRDFSKPNPNAKHSHPNSNDQKVINKPKPRGGGDKEKFLEDSKRLYKGSNSPGSILSSALSYLSPFSSEKKNYNHSNPIKPPLTTASSSLSS